MVRRCSSRYFAGERRFLHDVSIGSTLEYFTIYSRWRQMIFTTSMKGAGCDGKLKDKAQPEGSYVWICRYLVAGKKEIETRVVVTLPR